MWHIPVILALGRLSDSEQRFEVSLSYIANSRTIQ